MSALSSTAPTLRSRPLGARLARHRPAMIPVAVFVFFFLLQLAISPTSFGYFDFNYMSTGGAPLALTAMGETVIVLSGGFDLSAGAVVSLVNVILANTMQDSLGSQIGMGLAALAIGGLVGAFNGFFVAFLRLQSIVVTLATMFIVQGCTLVIMDKPGGQIPPGFSTFLAGDAIPELLPCAVAVLIVALVIWGLIKRTRLGTAIYAVGSEESAAGYSGINVQWTKFLTFVLGGCFYGAAGAFISAQTGSADPLVGNAMLLPVFAAVVLGGTTLGGGRGGCFGSVIAAYVLMIVINVLLVLNVSSYYSSLAEGVILVIAALAQTIGPKSRLGLSLAYLGARWSAWRTGTLPSHLPTGRSFVPFATAKRAGAAPASWLTRHEDTLRFTVPSYIAFILVVIVTAVVLGPGTLDAHYFNSLVVLCGFLAILALGQGSVIITGGLDLSVPWTISLCAIILTTLAPGDDIASLWAIPLALAVGALIGLCNGVGVTFFGLPPIVCTLASNAILQGITLVYCNGTPSGFSPPAVRWFMTKTFLGVTPVVWFLGLFVLLATLLLERTILGRRFYAVGNGSRAAYLSGINVPVTTTAAYMLSGFCSALVGVLLSGFNGQATLGMGDEYLLPSIAVVVVGGTLITGGRGHYLGMVGGVLLLVALQTLLAGSTLPYAARSIIFGMVILGAIVSLRERST
ncbi:MAG TPA: ABC transporter permease [Hypericibacter adhaerens]|jgi:ribose transport system permease protein|uniref:ABC transporter permease n=1 Tax=Hypericibacter adhaerens TaxID=2602016 RepID=A0A5J6N484_9PROT|nr:ABC transporter permease [Hypericibacter adhaerens]QEX24651.1 ABC transporter permease [Hypericibacter adhaerens]HWA45861.1 ABC transporter permease [Hypericibacter adhaerens]